MAPAFEPLVRDYASGKLSWSMIQTKGYTNYLDVLAKLHELGLRPPSAPDDIQAGGLSRLRSILRAEQESQLHDR